MHRLRFVAAACFVAAVVALTTAVAPSLALTPLQAQESTHKISPAGRGAVVGIGAISGVIFFDANGDGTRGPDEVGGIEGATLTLASQSGFPVPAPVTTGPGGAYQFSGLDAGTYVITQVNAPGYLSTSTDSITVNVGSTSITGVNFGDTLPFTITGSVYNDMNGDGVQQPAEPGIGAVPVELYDDANFNGLVEGGESLLHSTITDEMGVYILLNVMPGFRVLHISPPSGTSPGGNQAPLNLISFEGGIGAFERSQHFPVVQKQELAPACAFNTSVPAEFNSQALPASQTIWFTARLKATGLSATGTTVYFENGLVQFGWNNTSAHLAVPRGKVVFDPAAATTTSSYDAGTQTWTTTVSPGNWDKDVFLTGLAFAVPSGGLPSRISPIAWSGRLAGTTKGVTLEWKWSASVYTAFATDNNALGVKPVSSNVGNPYLNGNKAGTPENFKAYVTDGARGSGGTNFTGTDTPAVRGLCISPAVLPYEIRINCGSVSYTSETKVTWAADRKYSLGGWGYLDGAARSSSSSVAWTQDDFLYQKYREKPGEYRFTVPDGGYKVTLKFAEFSATGTERAMRLSLEGVPAPGNPVNIFALTKGKYIAYDKTYNVTVSDGLLNILFERAPGASKDPIVSAIEVVEDRAWVPPLPTPTTPPPPPTPTPVTPTPVAYVQTVNAGSTTYTAGGTSTVWAGDKAYQVGSWGYTGGSAKSVTISVENTEEDLLYATYRENPHEYRFTVPNGEYDIVLKFAEFVVSNATDRMMKISIEGNVVEPSLSIYGNKGKNTAFDRAYVANVTDGVLNISFVKASGSAKEPVVSAIKVHSR